MNTGTANPEMKGASKGQTLIEFALVIPLIILLFMGVFDFGRGIFAYNAVSNAARQGVRTAIVNQNETDIRSRASQQATALGIPSTKPACPTDAEGQPVIGAVTSDPTGTCVSFEDSRVPGTDCRWNTTTKKLDLAPPIGCVATITVKYSYTPITPALGQILGPIALTSTTRQPIESVCTTSGCPVP